MGAGASAQRELEAVVACTYMLGQAVSRVFPDIYSIDDFDVNKPKKTMRPPLFNLMDDDDGMTFEPLQSSAEDADAETGTLEEESVVPRSECFVVEFRGREVLIESSKLSEPNDDGWTPLHACCHQHAAVDAAAAVVSELKRRGEGLEKKTRRGPGSFASGWTALHISSAYGIIPTVRLLLENGAEIDAVNTLGWTPLHEAAHRGYVEVVAALLEYGAKTNIICPPCLMAPQIGQYPLAHACRQGHHSVVKALLDGGADKNAHNDEGWAALHEACYYNQERCVETMLVYGCDLTLETLEGQIPVELATLQSIKDILNEHLPPGFASKRAARRLQMELELTRVLQGGDGSEDGGALDMHSSGALEYVRHGGSNDAATKGDDVSAAEVKYGRRENTKGACADEEEDLQAEESRESKSNKEDFRLLGDLPGLPGQGKHGGPSHVRSHSSDRNEMGASGGKHKSSHGRGSNEHTSRRRRKKKKAKNMSDGVSAGVAPPQDGVPPEYACALTGKALEDPVATPYGPHRFEAAALSSWLKTQGNICPVTGAPLSSCEVKADDDLKLEVQNWKLHKAMYGDKSPDAFEIVDDDDYHEAEDDQEDDALYDF